MESLYWVICPACHRRCKHCYDDRFRPYTGDALEEVVRASERAVPRILANLPAPLNHMGCDGAPARSRVVLAGGEVLVEPVRERVLYPVLEGLFARYQGSVDVIVQTTGDLVTAPILDALLARGVTTVSISGMDDFHVGLEGKSRLPVIGRLESLFESRGMAKLGAGSPVRKGASQTSYHFFGATEGSWIGKLWPRGRAWQNGLTRATLDDNFCNAWSGGLNFLKHGQAGSEVSIEPDGKVYPCCLKTGAPLGDLTEEPLLEVLESLKDEPALKAIDAGDPEGMGEAYGLSREAFRARSTKSMPTGEERVNLCLGCDAFFVDVLGPILARKADERRARREQQALRAAQAPG